MIEKDSQYLRGFARHRVLTERLELQRVQALLEPLQELRIELGIEIEETRCERDRLAAELREYDRGTGAGGRDGDWMPTFTGRRFWILDPRPGDIEIEDVAQGLSRTNRYCGATLGEVGYSVAQHSVEVSRLVRPERRLAALLHDAPEAYVCDVITPLKDLLGVTYSAIEDRIMAAVASRFGFAWDSPVRAEVKYADNVLLATEVRDLLPFGMIRIAVAEPPLLYRLAPWPAAEAKEKFLARFGELVATT